MQCYNIFPSMCEIRCGCTDPTVQQHFSLQREKGNSRGGQCQRVCFFSFAGLVCGGKEHLAKSTHTHTHIHRELCGSVRLTTLHLPCWLLVFCFVFMACVSTGNKCLHFLLRLDVFIASFSYFCRFYWCFGFICIVIGGFPDLVEYN